MNVKKLHTGRLGSIIALIVFATLFLMSCSKKGEIKDLEEIYKNISIIDVPVHSVSNIFRKPSGDGFVIVGAQEKSTHTDVVVIVLDNDGKLVSSNTFGGTGFDNVFNATMDSNGDIYVVGATNSFELRMDGGKDTSFSYDGYVARLNGNGELLWQFGLCDTMSNHKGVLNDNLRKLYVIDDMLVCVGTTQNWSTSKESTPSVDTWVAILDKNGTIVRNRILPSVNYWDGFEGIVQYASISLKNGDIVAYQTYLQMLSTKRDIDTTTLITRYNPKTDQIIWTKGFYNFENAGDSYYVAQASDGNIITVRSTFNQIVRLNVNTGDEISLTETGIKCVENENAYLAFPFGKTIGDRTYFVGQWQPWFETRRSYEGIAFSLDNPFPWIFSSDANGEDCRSTIMEGYRNPIVDVIGTDDGNLLVVGTIDPFESRNSRRPFILKVDTHGKFIVPEVK